MGSFWGRMALRPRMFLIAALVAAVACAAGAAPASAACPSQAGLAYDPAGQPGSAVPNDPLWPKQWGPAMIRAADAWLAGGTGAGAVVAVVDSGVDAGHPDLAGKVLSGADFAPEQCSPGAQDENGHGTHVAGIVAAVTGNGIGVAGVAPGAAILPVRVLDSEGESEDLEPVLRGIRWAADQGAHVINVSIGEELPQAAIPWEDWQAAIDHAWSRGAVVVTAAGNEPSPVCESPSNLSRVVCVAAVDRRGSPSHYSAFPVNLQGSVALRAPGGSALLECDEDIWSTVWPGAADDTCGPRGYEPYAGTSMAAPHVSGVAAILAAGGLSNAAIVNCLRGTSSNRGSYDPVYGYGIVDARAAAVSCGARFPASPAPTSGGGATGGGTTGGGTTGGGATGGGSSGGTGVESGPDRVAPVVRLALSSTRRARVARVGRLPVRVRSSERATISIRVVRGSLRRATRRGAVVLARGIVVLRQPGVRTARLRLTAAGQRFVRQRRTRTISLLARARDTAGNVGTTAVQRRLR